MNGKMINRLEKNQTLDSDPTIDIETEGKGGWGLYITYIMGQLDIKKGVLGKYISNIYGYTSILFWNSKFRNVHSQATDRSNKSKKINNLYTLYFIKKNDIDFLFIWNPKYTY